MTSAGSARCTANWWDPQLMTGSSEPRNARLVPSTSEAEPRPVIPRSRCWRVMRPRWQPKVPLATNRLGGDGEGDRAFYFHPGITDTKPPPPSSPYVSLISP